MNLIYYILFLLFLTSCKDNFCKDNEKLDIYTNTCKPKSLYQPAPCPFKDNRCK